MERIISRIYKIREEYALNYGMVKIEKILNKIADAEITKTFMIQYLVHEAVPTSKEIHDVIHSIRYFMIAKRETIHMGALFLFEVWLREVNAELDLLNEDEANAVLDKLIIAGKELRYID